MGGAPFEDPTAKHFEDSRSERKESEDGAILEIFYAFGASILIRSRLVSIGLNTAVFGNHLTFRQRQSTKGWRVCIELQLDG